MTRAQITATAKVVTCINSVENSKEIMPTALRTLPSRLSLKPTHWQAKLKAMDGIKNRLSLISVLPSFTMKGF